MVIGIVGEKLAGKDEAGAYLAQRHKAFYIKYSHLLDEILSLLDLPNSRRNEIDLGKGLRDAFQRSVLWGGLKKKILESPAEIKAIGSIRLQDEFDSAKAMGANIIYITAPPELRYRRSLERKEKADDGQQTLEQFAAQEQEWTEKDIPSLGAQADFKIENTGSLEELYKKIDEIINAINPK